MNIEHIWKEYRSAIKAFLHSRVSNAADVEDLLQEILIKTYKNLKTLKTDSSVKSWIFKIANNVIIDFYRKKSTAKDITADDLWYKQDNTETQDELVQCIEPFIQALPEENAELLHSIDMQGESQKTYAEQHNISYSTLKSRVQKSRSQLRALFENCCQLSLDKHGNVIDCDPKSNDCKQC